MKFFSSLNKSKKFTLSSICVLLALVFASIYVWIGDDNSMQAAEPMAADVTFSGEYKIANGRWNTIEEGMHIPATLGDVTLSGCFQLNNPTTGEYFDNFTGNGELAFYLNHLSCTITMPNGQTFTSETENASFGEDACAATFESFYIPAISSDDKVTIRLHNPHTFGNEGAVDAFLENISINAGIYFEMEMLEKGSSDRNVGMFVIISALIILGIAAFSTFIGIRYSKEMWLIGLMTLFAGGYFLFDSFAVGLWNGTNITNTRILGLCMMFYMQFVMMLVLCVLKDIKKQIATATCIACGITSFICISLSLFDIVKFYDTWVYWVIIELFAIILYIICIGFSFKNSKTIEKFLYSTIIVTLLAFPVDALATKLGFWEGGLASKHIFIAIFIMTIVIVLRIIPSSINAAMKAKQLEAEQQALELELQESRISIMLSQMQPHFIFNTLNTIYHLCEINPDVARSTISSFSEYLRNNIDNLGHSDMIEFEKELSFVKTYLDIEKVRFDDELEISFNINATNFKLPVLTVQPIVENAVKHGTSKKEGGAKLFISTSETEAYYEIIIADTGVGFDTATPKNDGHKHVGINSVRQRLKNLCNGSLTIESTVGLGTTATIRIPKKGENS